MYDHLRPGSSLQRRAEDLRAWDWTSEYADAARLFAVGSLLLLVPWAVAMVAPSYGVGSLVCLLTGIVALAAVAAHGMGWVALARGASGQPTAARRTGLLLAFLASIAVFVAGVVLTIAWGGAWWALAVLFLPFIPWVWCPVVLAHAFQFLVAGMLVRDVRTFRWSVAGAAALVAVAGLGLSYGVSGAYLPWSSWASGFLGATAAGYGILALGWSRH